MAETTTAQNACAVGLWMDNDSGIPVDISGSANGADSNFSQQLGEFQVFGGEWIKRLACKADATVDLKIVYSTAANEGWKLLKSWWQNYRRVARTIRMMVPTEVIGADDFTGEFLIASLDVPLDGGEAGPIMVALSLVQTGGVTIGTVAT